MSKKSKLLWFKNLSQRISDKKYHALGVGTAVVLSSTAHAVADKNVTDGFKAIETGFVDMLAAFWPVMVKVLIALFLIKMFKKLISKTA